MHEYISLDLNWYFHFIITAFAVFLGLIYLVKNTASKYFVVDEDFDSPSQSSSSSSPSPTSSSSSAPADTVVSPPSQSSSMPGLVSTSDPCVVCGQLTKKFCARCKAVRYCSEACQRSHWTSWHKAKCEEFQLACKSNLQGRRNATSVALVPGSGTSTKPKKVLFPYDKFVQLFNWKKPGFPPCGLLNCGNSCFANVVLQCLAYTRPLAAYLLEKGHQRGCRRNDWCFLCELQTHVERASQSIHAFSPINILSRLPNIGGNLGYGKQEDAHEFMRFAIDTMQSVCLDEYGGERAVHPSSQETTLIQHIFGGYLRSQVICTKCNNVSNQFENMMDLIVEIQGDAASLEECLDQFTAKEWLEGDNMYKCDGCNDYVLAWKRLSIHLAPNILTIALKRFQSGRFGKLNKRVTFPETLDLSPYMSEAGDGDDKYQLYAVVVHVDMLNASFFGHYICYTKDFSGNWYRIDDCKVTAVELDEVLSQGAYMLLYSRVSARKSSLNPMEEPSGKDGQETSNLPQEKMPVAGQPVEGLLAAELVNATDKCASLMLDNTSQPSPTASSNAMDIDTADPKAAFTVSDGDSGNDCTVAVEAVSLPDETKAAALEDQLPLSVADIEIMNETDQTGAAECTPITDITNHVSSPSNVSENGGTGMGVSASSSSTGEPERADSSMCSVTEEASRNPPVTRLKPLISPGFLGKRPRRNLSVKRDGKACAETEENGDGKEKGCLKYNGSAVDSFVVSNGDLGPENGEKLVH